MSGVSDGLLDHLIFQVALTGNQGQNASEFISTVAKYHGGDVVDEEAASSEAYEDLFLSVKPPKKQIVLNSDYLESLWIWVSNHNDINITTNNPPTKLQPSEHTQNQQAFLAKNASARLTTTEDRIWHAIADHGKDWQRIPKSEFHCLCVIAAHGIRGVLQPDVVKITGQDKRSVPIRTEKLAQKGYITKEPVMGGGSRTSLLRLKKFSNTKDSSISTTTASNDAQNRSSANTASVISYDQWFDAVVKALQESDDAVAAETIRKVAGASDRISVRAMLRCLKRIEMSGLIGKVSGHVDRTIHRRGVANKVVRREVRAFRLLRDPLPADRDAFIADLKRTSTYMQSGRNKTAESDEEDDVVEDDSDTEVDAGIKNEADVALINYNNNDTDGDQEVNTDEHAIPSWTADVHFSNLLYDLVDSFGVKGVSSMELAKFLSSTLWRKPFDDTLGRLTDVWQISQPPHLRHLAIVRDTDLSGTNTHYTFRTILNFQKAVQNGNVSWDYLTSDAAAQEAIESEPTLDSFGFHCIPVKDLFDPNLPAAACAISACGLTGNRIITAEARATMSSLKAVMISEKIAACTTESPIIGSIARVEEYRTSKSSDTTLTASTLKVKRKLWTKRYHEAVAAWDARIRQRAKDTLVTEELRKVSASSTVPVRKRGRPKKIDQSAMRSDSQLTLSFGVDKLGDHHGNTLANPSTHATEALEFAVATKDDAEAGTPSSKRSRKRKRAPQFHELNISDERLRRTTDDLLHMERPGVYINQPAVVMMHRDETTTHGRPRNGLLATFKSRKLKDLPWMASNNPEGPSLRLQAWVPELFPALHPLNTTAFDELDDSADGVPATPSKKSTKRKPVSCATDVHEATVLQDPQHDSITTEAMGPPPLKRRRVMSQSGPNPQAGSTQVTQEGMHNRDIEMSEVPAITETSVVPDKLATNQQHPPMSITSPHAGVVHTIGNVTADPEYDASARVTPDDLQLSRVSNVHNVDRVEQGHETSMTGSGTDDAILPDQDASGRSRVLLTTTSPKDDVRQGAPSESLLESPPSEVSDQQHDMPASTGLNMWQTVKSANPRLKEKRPQPARKGVGRNSGQIEYQRAKIVLDIVRRCGGVFPGRYELFFPFATVWHELFNQLPDRKTLERSLRGLQLAKRIKKIPFTFETSQPDTTGTHSSYLLAEPHIDSASQIAKDTIDHIARCYPRVYLPHHVHVSDKITLRSRQHNKQPQSNGIYPPLPAYFLKDATAVSRPSQVPRLGRLEEELKASAEARAKKRLLESQSLEKRSTVSGPGTRNRDKGREQVELHQEDQLPPEVQEHTTEFQLSNYRYQPDDARMDRGPKGLARLSKRLRFQPTLQEKLSGPRTHSTATSNLRERRPAQDSWGVSSTSLDPVSVDEGTQAYGGAYDEGTILTLLDPETSFHIGTGTFATQPARLVNVRTRYPAGSSSHAAQVPDSELSPKTGFVNHIKLGNHPPVQPHKSVHVGILDTGLGPRMQAWKPSRASYPAGMYPPAPGLEASQPSKVRRVRQRMPGLVKQTWRYTSQALPDQQGNAVLLPKPRSVKQLIGDRLKQTEPSAPMTAKEEERLVYAVAVVTTLLGGLQQTARCTNYSVVNHAMHFKFDGTYCRQHYGLIKPKHGVFVEQLQQRFRVLFLHAFERDEVPAHLDLAVVENTNWAALVDWAQARLRRDSGQELDLPDTREDFDLEFEIEQTIKYEPNKDDFFGQYTSTVRKSDVIRSYAYFDPLPDARDSQAVQSHSPSMLLQSWIRANVLTPENIYNAATANVKLKTFGNDPLQRALDSMLGQQLIKGSTAKKSLPGRAYTIGVPLSSVYNLPWQFVPELFSGAAEFKAELDTAFDRSKDEDERVYELLEDMNNAQTLVVLNLYDHGLVDIRLDLPPIDAGFDMPLPKMTKWGFMKGSYKSRGTDVTHLSFPMTIRPTERYIFSETAEGPYGDMDMSSADRALCPVAASRVLRRPVTVLPVPLTVRYAEDESAPTGGSVAGAGAAPLDSPHRIPYWTDIHGRLMKSQLRQMVLIVLFLFLGRPGMHVADISKVLGGRVWEWELAVLCEWLGQMGVLERDDDDDDDESGSGGGGGGVVVRWRLSLWWFLALEAVEAQEGEEAVGAVWKKSGPARAKVQVQVQKSS